MKCFYVLLLVGISQAASFKVRASADIPAPKLVRLISLDPPGFRVEWTPVKSSDISDPVLGYKVKVWEQKSKKIYSYQMVNGVYTLVEQTVSDEFAQDAIPDWLPSVAVVEGPDATSTQFEHIQLGVSYEVRVQAYTRNAEGPLSDPMRIKLWQ